MQALPESHSVTNYLQERENLLTPLCISLLQTLPFHKSFVFTYVFQYHGFWYPAQLLNTLLSVQRNFQADTSDVILATNPKSGTTWLKALLFALLNRSKYSANGSDHPLLSNNPHDLVPFLEANLYLNYDHDQDPNMSRFAASRLFSTHIPFSALPESILSSGCKIVYLCRNPKDTLISNWHFINKLRLKEKNAMPLSDAVDSFCRGTNNYGPFWDHVLEYWKASQDMPDKVMFLKYEDVTEQPYEEVRKLSVFLGCGFSEVEEVVRLCSFDNLKGLEVNRSGNMNSLGLENDAFFRRGKVGDSCNYLTQEMMERIDYIMEDKFQGSMLKL